MLEQLVNEIRLGGTMNTAKLAQRLGTSPQLIEAMLEHLERSGLIQSYIHCETGCAGCSLHSACQGPDPRTIQLWQSTAPD